MSGRLLHYVYKCPKRADTVDFYRQLGMHALRHEEFTEGCDAQCNGPYSGHWSKSMIGYGAEDEHFVAELTYNYGVRSYKRGNAHLATLIGADRAVFDKAASSDYVLAKTENLVTLQSPCGYTFEVTRGETTTCGVRLASSDLERTLRFWSSLAQMSGEITGDKLTLKYANSPIWIEFQKVDQVTPGDNYGRTALAWPTSSLTKIEASATEFDGSVLTPYLTLPTPGKADVVVVIVADPDGHEVCFVGDQGFRDLSRVDAKAESLLDEAIRSDKSEVWHEKQAKRGITH